MVAQIVTLALTSVGAFYLLDTNGEIESFIMNSL